jgi:hypothetical protein
VSPKHLPADRCTRAYHLVAVHAAPCTQAPPACRSPSRVFESPSTPTTTAPRQPHTLFKLHKLRALRRKAKLKGGLIRTGPDKMASAGVPPSPTSSKRSRSRDSEQSGTTSSLNTPAANTPAVTPSVSTNSLVIPSSTPSTPLNGEHYVDDGTPYPPFLRQSRGGRCTRPNMQHDQSGLTETRRST